jgi:hypothetical protein
MALGNLLYIIAFILMISWVMGFFAYGVDGAIHLLLVLSILTVIVNVIRGSRA